MAGLDADTKLYLPLNTYSNGATAVDGALEVLDHGSGGNIITQVGNAAYQTTSTKLYNASLDFAGEPTDADYLTNDGLVTTLANDTEGAVACWVYSDSDSGTFENIWAIGRSASLNTTFLYAMYDYGSGDDHIVVYARKDGGVRWLWTSDVDFLDGTQGVWNHLIVNHNGTAPTIWWNGSDITSSNGAFSQTTYDIWFKGVYTDATDKANNFDIASRRYSGSSNDSFNGKLSDFRIFSTALTNDNIATLYNGGDGTTESLDGGETFWIQDVQDQSGDGGSGAYHIPDFIGTAQLDTAVTKYGTDTSSLLLDGISDYVSVPDSADWILGGGTGDFTVDYWIYFGTSTGYPPMWGQDVDTSNYYHSLILDSATYLFQVKSGGGAAKFDTRFTWNPADDTWYHVAIVREGTGANETKVYIDGVYQSNTLEAGAWDYTIPDLATSLKIGAIVPSGLYLDGSFAHFRVQDSAVWTENFDVPTEPYTAEEAASGVPGLLLMGCGK